jgi:hypothetical protein
MCRPKKGSLLRRNIPRALTAIGTMATKNELREMKNRMVTTFFKGQKRIQTRKQRTYSQRPNTTDQKCCCKISILLWEILFST